MAGCAHNDEIDCAPSGADTVDTTFHLSVRNVPGELVATLQVGIQDTGFMIQKMLMRVLGVALFEQRLSVKNEILLEASTFGEVGCPQEIGFVRLPFVEDAGKALCAAAAIGGQHFKLF